MSKSIINSQSRLPNIKYMNISKHATQLKVPGESIQDILKFVQFDNNMHSDLDTFLDDL